MKILILIHIQSVNTYSVVAKIYGKAFFLQQNKEYQLKVKTSPILVNILTNLVLFTHTYSEPSAKYAP